MVELIHDLRVDQVRENLERVRAEIAGAGRAPGEVEVLAAVKYVPAGELEVLADAGLEVLGENRAQDLEDKVKAYPGRFTWDFIGHLQSRKVRQIVPYVRYIHSVASDSVLAQLERYATPRDEGVGRGERRGRGRQERIAPPELDGFLERCPVSVVGLMTMPPLAAAPEDSRSHFAALRELAQRHGLNSSRWARARTTL